MQLFVDTSALVKLYYPEADSDQVEEKILRASRVYLCELTTVEFASALSKKKRMRELEAEELILIWDNFNSDLKSAYVNLVSLFEEDYSQAAQLILKHGAEDNLSTLDSLQLVAAIKTPRSYFVSADRILTGMANKIGLPVVEV